MDSQSPSETSELIPNKKKRDTFHFTIDRFERLSPIHRHYYDNRCCFLLFGVMLLLFLVMGMIPRIVTNQSYTRNNDLSTENNLRMRRRWNNYSQNNDPDYQSPESLYSEMDIHLGGDKDEHGCITSAGFTWCEQLHTCIQPWLTICPTIP